MQAFVNPLGELAEFEEIQKERRKKTGMIQIAGCVTSRENASDVCAWRWF